MKPIFAALVFLCFLPVKIFADNEVLIVADEFPAMQVLAGKLKAEENVTSQIVAQTNMPADWSRFAAALVYIHRDLSEPAEKAFIAYAKSGGKLVVLHHTISSGKRRNKEWFPFLGVALPEGDVSQGGYQWTEGVTLDIVNLAPNHFITTNKVNYPAQIVFQTADSAAEKTLPGFTLTNSEVYLNHVLSGPRTLLLGLKYTDARTGKLYMQSHAGWVMPSGKGWTIYLMSGHSARDFENPAFARIVANAVIWKP
jgi:Trehalose utilisation